MAVAWNISISDVQKHPKYTEDLKQLDSILSDYGMDIKQGYSDDGRWLIECAEDVNDRTEDFDEFAYFHTSVFTGEVCKGPRYCGTARQDGQWKRFVDRFLELPLI